jgi:hypothetical protein
MGAWQSGQVVMHEGQVDSSQAGHLSRQPRHVVSSQTWQYVTQSSQKSFSQVVHQRPSSSPMVRPQSLHGSPCQLSRETNGEEAL